MRATLLGVIGLICAASAAQGQLVGLNHVWTVGGAQSTAGGFDTFITCTNANTSSETIGVEMYDAAGNFVDTDGGITVAPNGTVRFGTNTGSASIAVDGLILNPPIIITRGSARVLSSATKGIICSAFLADTSGLTPVSAVSLTIAKKTKQKGD
jgi:hypothetical protein